MFARRGGPEESAAAVRARSGHAYDPGLATLFADNPGSLLELPEERVLEEMLAAEPEPHAVIAAASLSRIAAACGEFADLKSPHTTGHSSGVAALAGRAGRMVGLAEAEVAQLRDAASLHDLGRTGVPNGVWDKPGRLSPADWERVRLHPYYTERVLRRSGALAGYADVAGSHHERLDGSGYHRNTVAVHLSRSARLLAAADVCQAMSQPRPYRPALSERERTAELSRMVSGGELDRDAVAAVLEAEGQPARLPRMALPGGLTEREAEVLRLAATGLSNKQMAARLSVAPKTVAHHVQHTYNKIDVSARAGAALYAMEHGLCV